MCVCVSECVSESVCVLLTDGVRGAGLDGQTAGV